MRFFSIKQNMNQTKICTILMLSSFVKSRGLSMTYKNLRSEAGYDNSLLNNLQLNKFVLIQ